MRLRDASDFILETPVTWTDFESNLRTALGTAARFGPCKAVLDIGEGNGFASRCGLITCDWEGAAEAEKLPAKVVLKIPSILPFRALIGALPNGKTMFASEDAWQMLEGKLREVHNVEVVAYDFLSEFEGLAMPKRYYGRAFEDNNNSDTNESAGQLCLEYVEHARMMHFHERHTVEQVRQIAVALGQLQACSLKKEPAAAELHKDFFAETASTITLEAFIGKFKGVCALDSSPRVAQLMEKVTALLPEYYASNLPSTIHRQMGFRPVLVNGDLRTENALIDADTGNLAALIDWQCTHLGVGVEDLIRIAIFALTAEERRASMPMLITAMHASLVEHLDGDAPPYTLDTLLHLADLLYPHCALFAAGACIALITNQERDPLLSAEEKATRKEVEMDKLLGSLEDILEFHERNKNHVEKLNFRDY